MTSHDERDTKGIPSNARAATPRGSVRPVPLLTAAAALTIVAVGVAVMALAPRRLIPDSKLIAKYDEGANENAPAGAAGPAREVAQKALPSSVPQSDQLLTLGYARSVSLPPSPPARGVAGGVVGGVLGGVPGGVVGSFPEEFARNTRLEESSTHPWHNTESYQPIHENDFLMASQDPLSTFSIDVDTASYAIVRRFLKEGRLPPADAVRIEEMINYFPYHDPAPAGEEPFSVNVEIAGCPWAPDHRLARIGLRGREIARDRQAGTNLVFLLDVSGSMEEPSKLPLLKSALSLLVDQVDESDEVSIVVYAGSSGLVLPPTRGDHRSEIKEALGRLEAGGSTNGGDGLQLAYKIAGERHIKGGVNRVILATDGDFNVGITNRGELPRFVEEQARGGVALSVLGFGMGNYKDDMLEMLADHGDGNYAYIDSLQEARKVLVEQVGGTMVTIAKDVKIQVEFNPAEVGAYRLLGYENRLLRKEDFNDDRKDAGEIGAGHSVTALYEMVPPGATKDLPTVDVLKYQTPPAVSDAAAGGEAFTVKLRYKEPNGGTSRLITLPIVDEGLGFEAAPDDLRFAAAVAALGMILKDSAHKGSATFDQVLELASRAAGADEGGYRSEFIRLVELARRAAGSSSASR